jgi:hypothetical protein
MLAFMAVDEPELSGEDAVKVAADRGLAVFQYGDLLSLLSKACDTSWERSRPWRPSAFLCPKGCSGDRLSCPRQRE